jgi:hypothetical protein
VQIFPPFFPAEEAVLSLSIKICRIFNQFSCKAVQSFHFPDFQYSKLFWKHSESFFLPPVADSEVRSDRNEWPGLQFLQAQFHIPDNV